MSSSERCERELEAERKHDGENESSPGFARSPPVTVVDEDISRNAEGDFEEKRDENGNAEERVNIEDEEEEKAVEEQNGDGKRKAENESPNSNVGEEPICKKKRQTSLSPNLQMDKGNFSPTTILILMSNLM